MSFNLFKNVFGSVSVLAKAMDNTIDSFTDELIKNLKNFGFDNTDELLSSEESVRNFRENVVVKAFDVFSEFKMKIKKPKSDKGEEEKKRTTGFILFNIEKRESLKANQPDAKFEVIGKLVGDAWKQLSVEEQEEYNKKAAKINGVEYKKNNKEKTTLPNCSEEGCTKKCKSEAIDGQYFCADHKKKEKKPLETCAHIKKGGIKCSTMVKDGNTFCSKHKEKTDSTGDAEKIIKEKIKKPVSQSQDDKKDTDSSKKTEKNNEKKKSESQNVSKETKSESVAVKKADKKDSAERKFLSKCKFDFEKEFPVPISEASFWTTSKLKDQISRINIRTGLILDKTGDKTYLSALNVDGDMFEVDELPKTIIEWVKKCGILLKSDDELESEETEDEHEIAELEDDE